MRNALKLAIGMNNDIQTSQIHYYLKVLLLINFVHNLSVLVIL